jgi:hypothetical protein
MYLRNGLSDMYYASLAEESYKHNIGLHQASIDHHINDPKDVQNEVYAASVAPRLDVEESEDTALLCDDVLAKWSDDWEQDVTLSNLACHEDSADRLQQCQDEARELHLEASLGRGLQAHEEVNSQSDEIVEDWEELSTTCSSVLTSGKTMHAAKMHASTGNENYPTKNAAEAVETSSREAKHMPHQACTEVRHKGVIKYFRGSFGWVDSPEVAAKYHGHDVFLHKRDCDGMPKLGENVSFILTEDDNGNPKAIKAAIKKSTAPAPSPLMISARNFFASHKLSKA